MAAYEVLLLNTAVPQIQAAQAGDTYVVPRDIAVTADLSVTGNTILGDAATDTVQVNGYMGVGGAADSAVGLKVQNTPGGTSPRGIISSPTFPSTAVANGAGILVSIATQDATFTIPAIYSLRATDVTKGASSTITSQYGVYINDQTQGTNNFGITSLVSSGTNKWNIYASGTAANYFSGNVGIGTSSPAEKLHVYGVGSIRALVEGTVRAALFLKGNSPANTDSSNIVVYNASDTPLTKLQFNTTDDTATANSSLVIFTSESGVQSEKIRFSSLGTIINETGADYDFRVESDTNTHALFVQGSDGNVGIGTSSPGVTLHTSFSNSGTYSSSSASVTTPAGTEFIVQNTSSTTGSGSFLSLRAANTSGTVNYAYIGAVSTSGAHSPTIVFGQRTNATAYEERMRIDSSGNVGIGTATPVSNTNLTLAGSGSGSVTGGGVLSLFRTSTSVISSNNLGSIHFTGADTTSSSPTTLAYIRGQASGTHDPGDNPTDLVFGVTADGTETVYEAVRINQAGGIVTSPIAGGHTVFNEDGVDADFRVESDTNTHALFVQGSDGKVGIGTSTPAARLNADLFSNGAAADVVLISNGQGQASTNAGTAARLYLSGSTSGLSRGTFISGVNVGGTVLGNNHALTFGVSAAGASPTERMRIDSSGNVSIGGSADRATTVGTKALNIFDGTAPVGTLTNGISLYSSSGEAYVMDAAGNATLFSPHDAETNEWIFKSKHTPSGKVLKIDVEKMLRFINDHFGLDAIHEFTEE